MIEECRLKLADDFVPHPRFGLDPVYLTAGAFPIRNHLPWRFLFERQFVKRTAMEQQLIDQAWATLSAEFRTKITSWDKFEELWKAEQFGAAIGFLADRVNTSSSINKEELLQIIVQQSGVEQLPSVQLAPLPKSNPQ